MIPYLLFYLLLAVCAAGEFLFNRRFFFGVALMIVALFAGLRYETGYDWYAYELFYRAVDDLPTLLNNPLLLAGYNFEPGYSLLNSAVMTFGGGLASVFLIAAWMQTATLGSFLHRYAKHPMLVMLGYVSICYLGGQFIMIRFAIAASLMLHVFRFAHERRFFLAGAFFLAAVSFHLSVVIFLVLPVLGRPKVGNLLIFSALFVFCLCLVSGGGVQDWVFSGIGSVLNTLTGGDSQPLLGKVSSYSGFTSDVSSTSLIFACLNLLFYFCASTRFFHEAETSEEVWLIGLARSLTVLLLLVLLLFPQLQTLWNRIMLVSCPLQLIVMSNLVRPLLTYKRCNIYLSAYILSFLFFGYSILKPEPNFFLPYESTIQAYLFGSQGGKRAQMLNLF